MADKTYMWIVEVYGCCPDRGDPVFLSYRGAVEYAQVVAADEGAEQWDDICEIIYLEVKL